MPSPFHQKYSTQNHRVFVDNIVPQMAEGPKADADRRASDASVGSSPSSPTDRRRSSGATRFAALEALKRPTDQASTERRSSMQDSYIKPGFFGSMWHNYTRGPSASSPPSKPKEPRDTTTLRQ